MEKGGQTTTPKLGARLLDHRAVVSAGAPLDAGRARVGDADGPVADLAADRPADGARLCRAAVMFDPSKPNRRRKPPALRAPPPRSAEGRTRQDSQSPVDGLVHSVSVGVGVVRGEPVPLGEFKLPDAAGVLTPAADVLDRANYYRQYIDAVERSEYFVPVERTATVPLERTI